MATKFVLADALDYVSVKHRGQVRDNGVPFLVHPFGALGILMEYGVQDEEVLVAAVLHDVVEDCGVTLAELQARFGWRVASIVEEVTKKSDGSFPLKTRDGFVVKMADRLSNLNDLKSCSVEKQKRVAKKSVKLLGEYGKEMKAANTNLYCCLVDTLLDLLG